MTTIPTIQPGALRDDILALLRSESDLRDWTDHGTNADGTIATVGPRVLGRIVEGTLPTVPKGTGIRKANDGSWIAVKNGRVVATERGTGSKARAIRAAGTNTNLA